MTKSVLVSAAINHPRRGRCDSWLTPGTGDAVAAVEPWHATTPTTTRAAGHLDTNNKSVNRNFKQQQHWQQIIYSLNEKYSRCWGWRVSLDGPDKVSEVSDHRERCQQKLRQFILKSLKVDLVIKQIHKVSIPKTSSTSSCQMSVSLTVLLAPLWFIFTFWWCHREISRSIQIVSLVILTAAMCVSPAISGYLPRDNVMTSEGWCHCPPGDHVTMWPVSRAPDTLWLLTRAPGLPLTALRPGSRAQWSPPPAQPGPNPCPSSEVMWGHHGVFRPQLVQVWVGQKYSVWPQEKH